jgi:hypothetical protein
MIEARGRNSERLFAPDFLLSEVEKFVKKAVKEALENRATRFAPGVISDRNGTHD